MLASRAPFLQKNLINCAFRGRINNLYIPKNQISHLLTTKQNGHKTTLLSVNKLEDGQKRHSHGFFDTPFDFSEPRELPHWGIAMLLGGLVAFVLFNKLFVATDAKQTAERRIFSALAKDGRTKELFGNYSIDNKGASIIHGSLRSKMPDLYTVVFAIQGEKRLGFVTAKMHIEKNRWIIEDMYLEEKPARGKILLQLYENGQKV